MIEKWARYIRRYEGFSVRPYQCPTGHLTIGYGHNLENGISKKIADFILLEDIYTALQEVSDQFDWWYRLGDVRQFVLVDMCFNMGLQKLCTFKKMLTAAQRGDYTTAAREMLESRWAGQVGRRAHELAEMMKTGDYL